MPHSTSRNASTLLAGVLDLGGRLGRQHLLHRLEGRRRCSRCRSSASPRRAARARRSGRRTRPPSGSAPRPPRRRAGRPPPACRRPRRCPCTDDVASWKSAALSQNALGGALARTAVGLGVSRHRRTPRGPAPPPAAATDRRPADVRPQGPSQADPRAVEAFVQRLLRRLPARATSAMPPTSSTTAPRTRTAVSVPVRGRSPAVVAVVRPGAQPVARTVLVAPGVPRPARVAGTGGTPGSTGGSRSGAPPAGCTPRADTRRSGRRRSRWRSARRRRRSRSRPSRWWR